MGVWHLPVPQKVGQLRVTLHPQILLQCSKASESQTEIHSCPITSFIRLPFRLIGLCFLFFAATSASGIFSGLNGVKSLCFLHSQPHFSPRNVLSKPKHQNPGSGRGSADTVTTTNVSGPICDNHATLICMSLCFVF